MRRFAALLHDTRAMFWLIVVFAALVRLAVAGRNNEMANPLAYQPSEEVVLAQGLAEGMGYVTPFRADNESIADPSAHSPPAYPFLLATLIRLARVISPDKLLPYRAGLVLNMLAGSLAVGVLALAGGKAFGERGFWIAGFLCSMWPTMLKGSIGLWDTPFSVLAISSGLLLALFPSPAPKVKHYISVGLLWGLFTLFNPVVAPFLAAALLVRIRRENIAGRSVILFATACVGWLCCVAPYSIRNAVIFGRFVPIRNNFGLELWLGNQSGVDGTGLSACKLHPMNNRDEKDKVGELGEDAYMRQKSAEALQIIRGDPEGFFRRTLERIRLFWLGDHRRPTRFMGFNMPNVAGVNLGKPAANMILLLFALLGAFSWRSREGKWLSLFGLAYLPLPYYVTHVSPHFRVFVDPILCFLAAGFLAGCVEKLARRNSGRIYGCKHNGASARNN